MKTFINYWICPNYKPEGPIYYYIDLCNLFKLLNGFINSPSLLAQVNLHVPARRNRRDYLFKTPFHRTNYGFHTPIDRICRLTNELPDSIDIFCMTFAQFKSAIRNVHFWYRIYFAKWWYFMFLFLIVYDLLLLIPIVLY